MLTTAATPLNRDLLSRIDSKDMPDIRDWQWAV